MEKHIKRDPLISLAQKCYKILPGLLTTIKNEKCPWPNVDALSGVIFYHYGLKESEFFVLITVVARSLGCMANLIVTNALGKFFIDFKRDFVDIGTERPFSINLSWLEDQAKKKIAPFDKEDTN